MFDLENAKLLDIRWPDIYYSPAYAEADLTSQGSGTTWELVTWKYSDLPGDVMIVHGYFKRPTLYGGRLMGYDLCSCYGYSGPFAIGEASARDWALFRSDFDSFCSSSSYISEFIRFSPLCPDINNIILGFEKQSPTFRHWIHQKTVAVHLSEYWSRATTRHRTATRKALKFGYEAQIRPAALEDFTEASAFSKLYEGTMQRVSAKTFYYFKKEYYNALCASAPHGCLFIGYVYAPSNNSEAGSNVADIVVSSALFMRSGSRFHYHLSGSDNTHTKNGVNNLLLDAAARFAHEKLGCRIMHLGGGLIDGDGLYLFKRSVGDVELRWRVGAKVLNEESFDDLISLRAAAVQKDPAELKEGSYFPQYREGLSGNDLSSE